MSKLEDFFFRWRVRLGYPLAIAVLWFARPSPRSVFFGALIGTLGIFLRACAAGYLQKQEVLAVAGPYAYTRNPLYLGSAILALGAAVATLSWISSAILVSYFAIFYSFVMRREERELHTRYGTTFEEYARAVPLFFPRLTTVKFSAEAAGSFSFAQYRRNHEWQALAGFLLILLAFLLIWRLRLH